MTRYRIASVDFNNRSRRFCVRLANRDGAYLVPYAMAGVDGLVESVDADAEIGNDGFTWVTRDGIEGTMLAEQVLWIHSDPEVRVHHMVYELTIEARRRRREMGVGVRTLAAMMGTSPARVHTLLDPTVHEGKTINSMTKLLVALGAQVDVTVRDREATG